MAVARPAGAAGGQGGPAEISGPEREPTAIFGGSEAERCAWPTVVEVSGGGLDCTGTLVHPRVVMFAAHCGDGPKKIYFGEDMGAPGRTVDADFCMVNPDYGGPQDQEHDWGFCRLGAAITDLPPTPVVFGCEEDMVEPGQMAAISGFGLTTDDGDPGRKFWALTPIRQVFSESADVGGLGEPGICPGDSGGPAFVRYPDGSWHTFGIASTLSGGFCGGVGTHALAWNAVPFIEQNSGIDITPCHDADGTWNPTFRCTGFHAGEPGEGQGDWPAWCSASPKSLASTTCGAAFDAVPDDSPPTVAITTPVAGTYEQGSFSTAIEIAADDGDGWGVASVRIKVNGMEQPVVDEEAPYKFDKVDFPKGTWELVAVAEDGAGHVAESAPVTIVVGLDAPVTTGDADTTPTSTSEPGDTGTDTSAGDTAMRDAGEDGCGCASERRGTGALLVLLGALALRRRRRT